VMNVFISGSIDIKRLPDPVKHRLNNVVKNRLGVLIGDASGIDTLVQSYLQTYPNVTVYCSGNRCRNNVGNWKVIYVPVEKKSRGREFYTKKDQRMSEKADFGLIIWNGISKGSYRNINDLAERGKKVVVYVKPDNRFHIVRKEEDIFTLRVRG
jgi:hypothetical protein